MKTFAVWVGVAIALCAAGAGGYWLGHRGAGAAKQEESAADSSKEEAKPVATVRVVPIRRTTLSQQIIAYGSVIAPPNEVSALSVSFESRVTKVLVAPGQVVAAGQPVIEVEGSAATALALEEAKNAVDAAARDLQLVRQRFEQKLATNAELNAAENAARAAQARLRALQQGGAGGPRQLKADLPGVVSKVDVQMGQIVPIGTPLVEIAAQNRIEAKLGVEPEDAMALKPQQAVKIRPVGGAGQETFEGKIRVIGQRVDPMTRLVDVMVSPPPDARLMLEEFVTGELTRASAEALVVPRDAVLPNEEGAYELFTVKDGKAAKHVVKVGIETDQETQVIADDLKEGDLAVVVGNLELEDGMAVQVSEQAALAATEPAEARTAETHPAESQPAESQPAESQPAATSPAAKPEGGR